MNKQEYLNSNEVTAFKLWFAEELKKPTLHHEYSKPDGSVVKFSSLHSALQQYAWPFKFEDKNGKIRTGRTFDDSATALHYLADQLSEALESRDAQSLADGAYRVMHWGGVANGNVNWLQENVGGLLKEITEAKRILSGSNEDSDEMQPICRFNAGMTKVYSLLVKDFIIYDSRVAASLAWFVLQWSRSTGLNSVPELLAFPCMPAKEGDNPRIRKCRNPSTGAFVFPSMNGNSRRHAQWNLRASWLLEACLHASENNPFGSDLRQLEAALFMWGYDLNQTAITNDVDTQDEEVGEKRSDDEPTANNWIKGITRGKRLNFEWRFDQDKDAILINRGMPIDNFSSFEIFSILHRLYDEVGNDWFRLANNVIKIHANAEQFGLGSVIYHLGESRNTTHAQASSQLGPILERLGILEWNGKAKPVGFRILSDIPPTIESLRMMLAGSVE